MILSKVPGFRTVGRGQGGPNPPSFLSTKCLFIIDHSKKKLLKV